MRKEFLTLVAVGPFASFALAQEAASRATVGTPLIADFEQPASVAMWTGLKGEQTEAHATSGRFAMQLTFPKWEVGMPVRPKVSLAYADGKGYPTKDWSRYGTLTFDIWFEGDKIRTVYLELRDKPGRSGPTTIIKIKPGELTHAEVSLEEAAGVIDITDVREIVLYAIRPSRTFTVTIDNFRLLPAERPPPVTFDLRYPNYRNLIFPGAGDVAIDVTLHAEAYGLTPDQLEIRHVLKRDSRDGSRGTTTATDRGRGPVVVQVPVEGLPAGTAALTVTVAKKADGTKLASREWPLRMLTPAEVGGLRVYIDRHNNMIVDGKPFFPIGWYDNPSIRHLDEIANSPFNCVLAYGTNRVGKASMLKYLDAIQAKGLKLIYCMKDIYPTATAFDGKAWEGTTGNEAIADAVMRAYRDHPAILAWYLADEPLKALAPHLEKYYERVKENDPTRPCYVVLSEMAQARYFPNTADIVGVDPYPIPEHPVTWVSDWLDAARRAVGGHKPTWLVPQAFGWYQARPLGLDRARQPTEAELKSGRMPTYEESRCMIYLGLTHGAKGLIYYSYYDLLALPQHEATWGWMKKIADEVKTLSPVLLGPEPAGPAGFSPADAPIHTMLKRHDGRIYLIVVNSGREACRVTFDLKQDLRPQATVLFEDRTAATDGRYLTTDFEPLGVRVYELGASP